MKSFKAEIIHLEIKAELRGIHKLPKSYGYIALLKTENNIIPAYVSENKANELKNKINSPIKAFLSHLQGSENYLMQQYQEIA